VAKAKSQLVFGDDIYVIDDIFQGDLYEDNFDFDDCLLEAGEKGRFIAYKTDPEYKGLDIIVLFGDDTIYILYREMIATEPITIKEGYVCPVCGESNSIEKALEGCKGCGVPYDPINGQVGDGNMEEQAPT
jgi:rubredoxin